MSLRNVFELDVGVLIDEVSAQYGFAGDNATVILTNVDLTNIGIGTYITFAFLIQRSST